MSDAENNSVSAVTPLAREEIASSVQAALVNLDLMEDLVFKYFQRMRKNLTDLHQNL
ncbi:hypothetical protein [Aquitalea magnusonii]|uniref:Uncharacterized protein n=1 Tax=Aquitalea magnusonii TaxID=332411 RepID=A0A318J541_9NEIS|nr:hypothetical protein [Aquitalea magnusonii]PXX42241.1 hypothetical protein DFR38_12038 [Aquitalea magnusonii]